MHSANNLARTIVHTEPNIIDAHLADLGLAQEDLNQILFKALSQQLSVTGNNAVTAGGTFFYHEAVRAARDVLSVKGFKRLSVRNVELAVNDQIAVYICSGNNQTGLTDAYPESRAKKGKFTREFMGLTYKDNPIQYPFVYPDQQMALDFSFSNNDKILTNSLGLDIWCLLHYVYRIDEYQWGMRAEFSKPITYNRKNEINGFSTRLILNTTSTDPVTKQGGEPQFTPEIEIDILKTG
ncbi:hypothetical protein [Xenorhabdus sp. BG5]|uniref:hypothetical protein n=1 Tax=Xenorhabdus sp. BG5 TaxID=2782014 RepID=UPI001882280C|nr:hypothetical protein [Xenorhabdus sp. BG5]MBE8597872.1 hypothetical protein [Xenorhabdus sp. BG5]